MAGKTYKTRGIVLRKNKLGEKDLIVSVLDIDGQLLKAVAKGARKPGGSFAARLELFATVDLMLAEGRNLDVVTGATLVPGSHGALLGVEQSACAGALAELLCSLAQEGLPHEKLFPMAEAAFTAMGRCDPTQALALACSSLLKALAYAGFRPSFAECVLCGNLIMPESPAATVLFSVEEGGAICGNCSSMAEAANIGAALLQWSNVLMHARFDDVVSFNVDPGTLFDVLQLVRQWTRFHVGKNIKSLDFLLTCGLF